MKRLCMCVVALVMGIYLAAFVGCEPAVDAGKGAMAQLEKEFKKGTVLLRAKGQLADAQKSRADLKKMADDFHVDAEVSLKQIARLEEEKGNTVAAFKKLQDAARNAALPKFAEATPEDKAKTIQIGTKTFTGAEAYRVLEDYKAQVEKANAAVARERKQADFLKERAEKIRSQIPRVDNNIADMERQIADYEMYQKLLAANKKIESLGLSDDKLKELLNMDSNLAELRKEVDRAEVQLEIKDQESRHTDLKEELNRGSLFSITDDDLI